MKRSLAAALLFASCTCNDVPAPPSASASGSTSGALGPSDQPSAATSYTGKTTSPAIEIRNLDSQVIGAQKLLAEQPENISSYGKLVTLLLMRSRVFGKSADLVRAYELTEDALKVDKTMQGLLLRARGRSATHHFKAALEDLDLAEKALVKGESRMGIDSLRGNILMALGRYDEALPLLESKSRIEPNTQSLGDYAVLLGKMGKLKEADAIFLQAELKFRSISPIPLVDLYFDRASMWERASDLDLATKVYKAAHERLPQHVHVALHYAQLVAPSEGVNILETLTEVSDDADVFAGLGVLKNLLNEHTGDASIERAKTLYDEHFAKLPEAYADHAGWFWVNVGADPQKAALCATKNLEQRSTAEAYELAIAAGNAANDTALLCRAQREGKALKYPSVKLMQMLQPLEGKIACPADGITPQASASASAAPSAKQDPAPR